MNERNIKTCFRAVLQRKTVEKMFFVPFVYTLAARIANISVKSMVWEPTYYTNAMENAFTLINAGVAVNCYDDTVEAEALGCEVKWQEEFSCPEITGYYDIPEEACEDRIDAGRIPVILETTKRLNASLGREYAMISTLTGPYSLFRMINDKVFPEMDSKAFYTVGNFLTKLVRKINEIKVDAVFFREDHMKDIFLFGLTEQKETVRGIYGTMFNIVRAFNSYPVIVLKDPSLEVIRQAHALLKPAGFALLGFDVNEESLGVLEALSNSTGCAFGIPLSFAKGKIDNLFEVFGLVQDFIKKRKPRGFFLVSDGEIPADTPLEVVYELMNRVQTS